MAWSDYGINGLDATFAEVNTTLFAVLLAMKERLDAINTSNSYLDNMCNGYDKIRIPPWHYTQQSSILYTNWMRAVNASFRTNAGKFVESILNPLVYNVDYLGEKACRDLTQAGKTCVYDAREFANNNSDVMAYFNQFIGEIIPQAFVLKYKKMLDLMRYYMVTAAGVPPCCSVCYDNHNGAMDSTPAGAIASIEASQDERIFGFGSSWTTGSLLYALKNIANGTYCVNYIMKALYVEKARVDSAIASATDPSAPFFVFFDLRCRLIGTSTTEYYNYSFCAPIDTSAVFSVYGYGDCYKMTIDSTTNSLAQLFENLIDTIPATTDCYIYVDAKVGGIVQIFDGINTFQFLDV